MDTHHLKAECQPYKWSGRWTTCGTKTCRHLL